jgi:hypothetical protein
MHLEYFQDVLFIVTYGVAIVILSILADRKNRNPLVGRISISAWVAVGDVGEEQVPAAIAPEGFQAH